MTWTHNAHPHLIALQPEIAHSLTHEVVVPGSLSWYHEEPEPPPPRAELQQSLETLETGLEQSTTSCQSVAGQ